MKIINIAVIDDNNEFLEGIIRYFDSLEDIFVVGVATTKEQAFELIERKNIDIMLVDINLSENKCDGILIADQILTVSMKKIKIIMLTDYNNTEFVEKSFLVGAVYYVLKSDFKMLPDIIRYIHGSTFLMEHVLKNYSELMKDKLLKSKFMLSNTEALVYKLLEIGNKPSEVLKNLCFTESTYKKHINSILKKFKVTRIKKAIAKFKEELATARIKDKQ